MPEPSLEGSDAIRVLIAEVPGLLASVVRHTVNEERDMTVVEQVGSADIVVTSSPTSELGPRFQALLFGPTPLPIVTISLDGKRIDVYGRATTHGGGIEGLTGLIREAVAGVRPRIGG
jgi:hypothetical protein